MDKIGTESLVCPIGESSCSWLTEVKRLGEQVSELSEMVSTDGLTGLFNFRYFNSALQAEMDRSKRGGIPTSLVIVDIDFFKAVNDQYGHETGNVVLRHIARILRAEVRTTDIVCRYGGEEFTLIFPETHLNIAVKVADRIRDLVASHPITVDENKLNVTVSMGASVYTKTSRLEINQFIESADTYLYQAKETGRNRICHVDYSYLHADSEVSTDERSMLFSPD